MLLIVIWIIGTSFCFADGDDFNSTSINTNKWSLTPEFSGSFVHTNGYISFESTNERAPQWGYIYWKEKMSFSNNWSAKIQTYINPSFRPSNNFDGPPDVGTAMGGVIWFYDPPATNGVKLDGIIETQIGVTDNPFENTNNSSAYANTLLKGSDNKKYFNPNYDINTSDLGLNPLNTDSQFKEIFVDKVLLELGYNADAGSLYSKMFDYSDNTMGSLLYQDSFKIKLIQGESINDFDQATRDIVSQWESISDVYVFVGGDTYYSEAPLGSATLDNFEIVPEPSALSLLGVGLGVLFRRSRKRD